MPGKPSMSSLFACNSHRTGGTRPLERLTLPQDATMRIAYSLCAAETIFSLYVCWGSPMGMFLALLLDAVPVSMLLFTSDDDSSDEYDATRTTLLSYGETVGERYGYPRSGQEDAYDGRHFR